MTDHMDTLEGAKPEVSPLLIEQAKTYLTFALDATWPEGYREYFLGVWNGFAVAFGVRENTVLQLASAVYGAQPTADPTNAVNRAAKYKSRSDEVLFASGVLYGYKRGIAESPQASECAECGRGIREDLDDFDSCPDGIFCSGRDCFSDFDHSPACRLEREADEADDRFTDMVLDK
jgi:hypothetical protein